MNPLPAALNHYVCELEHVLDQCAVSSERAEYPSSEVAGLARVYKLAQLLRVALAPYRLRRESWHVIVCWPTFGFLEPTLWLLLARKANVSIVYHDIRPLRRQIGLDKVSSIFGRLAIKLSSRISVLAHSTAACDDLSRMKWEPLLIRHPIAEFSPSWACEDDEAPTLSIVGQYKHARDQSLLHSLATNAALSGFVRSVSGRGWPDVPGWRVDSRFLSEEEFCACIGSSSVILLPYKFFYQSGVAVRALELGVPVCAPRTPFMTDLMGDGWLGLWGPSERPDDIAGRIRDVLDEKHRMFSLWERYNRLVTNDWISALQQLR